MRASSCNIYTYVNIFICIYAYGPTFMDKSHIFSRFPEISVQGFIIGTYKNDFGSQ